MSKTKMFLFTASMLVSLLAFGLTLSSCAPSAATQAIISAPSVEAVAGLRNKLIWLESNAKSDGTYIVEIDSDEEIDNKGYFSKGNLSYKDKSNITIILRGVGTNRIISRGEPGTIFTVGSGVTLVLDGNITLKGRPSEGLLNGGTVVKVYGGTLVMNDGSIITGGFNNDLSSARGGGVYVSDGSTFIMKGGTISGNTCFIIPNAGMFAASKGKYNTTSLTQDSKGGGVYVSGGGSLFGKTYSSGTFIKTGGTITGYASDPQNGNVVRGFAGNGVIHNNGHAIYFAGPGGKEGESMDNTVGPGVSLHFSNGTFSKVQEEPKRKEIITEPPQADGERQVEMKLFDKNENSAAAVAGQTKQALQPVMNYKDGKPHGEWKMLHKNGNLSAVMNYKDGKQDGEWKYFDVNGNLKIVYNYKNGKQDGEQKTFYENGNLQSVVNYKEGKQDGEWKYFNVNGNLQSVVNYKDGKPDGEWKYFDVNYFDINGNLIRVDNYKDGVRQ